MTLDDCSLTYTTKRVPWWQRWSRSRSH